MQHKNSESFICLNSLTETLSLTVVGRFIQSYLDIVLNGTIKQEIKWKYFEYLKL